ncbi:MAG TPA: trigger factor [Acidimicrobiales bacterium]|nr:trigger factor [Acidimicrobiales bacterium]
MRTSAQPLEGNQVKLTVEVDEEEMRRAEEDTLRRLTREARIPGFRPGKVPRRLLEARLGTKVIREEVLRDALPRLYSDAVEEAELDVITSPEIDITAGEEGGPVAFDAVVEVRPRVAIVGYDGLAVTLPSPVPTAEEIDAQVDRLRSQFAELTEVDRPARVGDLVTLDLHGTRDGAPAEGLTADDLVYEVGTGGIVDGIDERLTGAAVGDELELDASDAPGGPAQLHVAVKQVREKLLPDADDAFAADASEFETIAELRGDLTTRIGEVKRLQTQLALREAAVEALVELVADEPPAVLVAAETERLVNDLVHRLSHQGATLEQYLESTGQPPESLLAELDEQAKKQVKADLALRALVEAESIEVDESELDEEIVRIAGQEKMTPARVRTALEQDGRLAGLRSQMASAKALAWLVEHVGIVDEEGKPMDRSELLLDSAGPADGGAEAADAAGEA